ncbi:hypothetical protein AYO38_07915 [bacterium SCGC AG-212-C10]|nr:hypothetical protein AYO38_07915 [bacterium SCGC AG-212-C10]
MDNVAHSYTCTFIDDVPAGGSFVVTVPFTVGVNNQVNTVIPNTIDNVGAVNLLNTVSSNTVNINLNQTFQATLTKVASPSSVTSVPTQTFDWIYTITNIGTGSLTGVTITDPTLDGGQPTIITASPAAQTIAVPGSAGCTVAANVLTCDLAGANELDPLVPGASFSFPIQMTTVAGAAQGTAVLNTAQFDSNETPQIASSAGVVTIDNSPILTITKTASSDDVGYGNGGPTTTFTITVNNVGAVDATGVVVADVLPAGLTQQGGTCVLPATVDIAAGANFTCTIIASLTGGTTPANGSSFVNTASATFNLETVSASAIVNAAVPHLTVSKSAEFGTLNAVGGADNEVFRITVTNDGNAPTGTGAFLRDGHVAPFDANADGLNAVGAFTASAGLPGCTAALFFGPVGCPITLNAGQTATVSFEAQADADKVDGTVLSNVAAAYRVPAGAAGANSLFSMDDATTVVAAPKLEVTVVPSKSPISVDPAEQFAFIITVKNVGHAVASDIVITDALFNTVGIVGVPTTFDVQMFAGVLHCEVTAGQVTCDDGGAGTPDLQVGDSVSIVVPVTADAANLPSDGDSLVNSATASCANCPNDAIGAGNVVVENDPAQSLTKSAPSTVNAGGTIAYVLTVSNGSGTARDYTVIDTLPGGVTNPVATAPCVIANNAGTVTWNVNVPANSSVSCTITVTVPANTPTNTSFLNSAILVLNGNEVAQASALTTVGAQVDLTKTGPASVTAGSDAVYTLTVTNNSGASQAVVVKDTLPGAPITFVSTTCAGATTAAGILTWSPVLNAGQSLSCTVTVNVPAGTPIGTSFTNTAALIINGLQVDSASVTTTVSNEQITITKTPSKNPVSSNPNETFAFNITVTNNGNATATGITVADTLPAELVVAGAFANVGGFTCAVTGNNDVVTCTGGTLAPGSSVNIAIPVRFDAAALPIADNTTISNTASVTACTISGVACADNPSASSTVTVLNRPVLSMVKTVESGDPVIAGQNVIYAVTVANSGGSDATVTINDAMPAALTNIQVLTNGGLTCNVAATKVITCTGTVPAGQSITLRFQGTVPANTANGAVK